LRVWTDEVWAVSGVQANAKAARLRCLLRLAARHWPRKVERANITERRGIKAEQA
jgi:hypothetical protein